MSGNNLQNINAATFYKDSLLPVYKGVCGDSQSYPHVEGDFESRLNRARWGYDDYAAVFKHEASPEKAARIFRNYLAGGSNCPEESPAGQALKVANSFKAAAHATAVAENGTVSYIQDPIRLYGTWQQYLTAYLSAIDELHEATQKLIKPDTLDFLTLHDIWKAANRSEITARAMEYEINKISKKDMDASWQGTTIFYQNQKMDNFRQFTKMIASAIDTNSDYKQELEFIIQLFQKAYISLHNPFDWASKVILEFFRDRKPNVELKIQDNPPKLRPANITSLWELIDQLCAHALEIAKDRKSTTMEMKYDGFKKHFVITLPSSGRPARSAISKPLRQLNGFQITPPRKGTSEPVTEFRVPMRPAPPPPSLTIIGSPTTPAGGITSGFTPNMGLAPRIPFIGISTFLQKPLPRAFVSLTHV